MKVDTKKLVFVMGSFWMNLFNIILFTTGFMKSYALKKVKFHIGYDFKFFASLFDVKGGAWFASMHFITFGLCALVLLFSAVCVFLILKKSNSPKVAFFPSEKIVLVLDYLFALSIILELVSEFVFINSINKDLHNSNLFNYKVGCGPFIILVLTGFMLFILTYAFVRFDSISPLVNTYEKKMVGKVGEDKKVNQKEVHLNREQRRKQAKRK